MANLDRIEKIADICGLKHRRRSVRSLTSVQIFDENANEWVLFDPVFHGKDVAKMLWHLARQTSNYENNEVQFRSDLLDWIIEMEKEDNGKDNAVSQES